MKRPGFALITNSDSVTGLLVACALKEVDAFTDLVRIGTTRAIQHCLNRNSKRQRVSIGQCKQPDH